MVFKNEVASGPNEKPIVMAKPGQIQTTVISINADTKEGLTHLLEGAKRDAEQDPEFRKLDAEGQRLWLANRIRKLLKGLGRIKTETPGGAE